MFTYIPMPHLPKVPTHFVERAIQMCKEQSGFNVLDEIHGDTYGSRKLIKTDGSIVGTRRQRGMLLGDDWEQWVRENITTNFYETGVRMSVGESTTHGAHSDAPPKWKLYYLIQRGGDDAVTYFYKEHGQPVVRPDSHAKAVIHCNDYNKMDIIDQVQWPIEQWCLMNGCVLHGIENVTGLRINLTIGFEPGSMDLTLVTPKLNHS